MATDWNMYFTFYYNRMKISNHKVKAFHAGIHGEMRDAMCVGIPASGSKANSSRTCRRKQDT